METKLADIERDGQLYAIGESAWVPRYDARIELTDSAILLHSRGGATGGRPARNTEYEKALTTIIRRLRPDGSGPLGDILLDSLPARKLPYAQRVLVGSSEAKALTNEDLIAIVRLRARKWGQAENATGGNSTKALRIETLGLSRAVLRAKLNLVLWEGITAPFEKAAPEGLIPASVLAQVKPIHVLNAIDAMRGGTDVPVFGESTRYEVLLDDGLRLAPKKVYALAIRQALGFYPKPGNFSAGKDKPCFRTIFEAGLSIVPKADGQNESVDVTSGTLPPDVEDVTGAEGNPQLVTHFRRERDRKLVGRKRAAFIQEHGRLFCERCSFDPFTAYPHELAAACIEVHHAKVQVKDMQPGHKTDLSDLQCLCANCHRVVHREIAQLGL